MRPTNNGKLNINKKRLNFKKKECSFGFASGMVHVAI